MSWGFSQFGFVSLQHILKGAIYSGCKAQGIGDLEL